MGSEIEYLKLKCKASMVEYQTNASEPDTQIRADLLALMQSRGILLVEVINNPESWPTLFNHTDDATMAS